MQEYLYKQNHEATRESLVNIELEESQDQYQSLRSLFEKLLTSTSSDTNSHKIANHYKGTEFDDYAKRIHFCSELLDFKLTPNVEEGVLKLKLSALLLAGLVFIASDFSL